MSSPAKLEASITEKDGEIRRLKRLVTELRGRVRLEGIQYHIELDSKDEAHKTKIEEMERMHAEEIQKQKRIIQDWEQKYKLMEAAFIARDEEADVMQREFIGVYVSNQAFN